MRSTLRDVALAVWIEALAAVHGERVVRAALCAETFTRPLDLIAMGKAALPMARGARAALGGWVRRALVVTGEGYDAEAALPSARFRVLTGDHPLPGERSLAAGAALVDFVCAGPPVGGWLVLLSGGASSLVEHPAPGVDLALLRRANAWLLASGLPIERVNAVRRRLSALKGGGLLGLMAPGPVWAGYLSDIPGDHLPDLASGPLFPERPPLPAGLPDWLAAACRWEAPPVPAVPVRHRLLAGAAHALAAAARAAQTRGWVVSSHGVGLRGEAAEVGARLGRWLAREAPPGVHLWGGETTVTLPSEPGRGGRNQTLALAAALELAGHDGVALLAGGTDGRDGASDHAGALVDGTTLARARAAGLDARRALVRADSAPLLAAVGDALPARATATNVADLVVAVRR